MLKEDIIKDIQKYVQSKDKSNLIVYLETTFSHNKLYKTCVNAKLIKMSKKRPTSNTLALILANKLMKTKTSIWDILFSGFSGGLLGGLFGYFVGATDVERKRGIQVLNKQEKNGLIVLNIMSGLLAGYAQKRVVDKALTRKRMLSSLARLSSQTRKRSSSSKPSKKRKRSSSSKPSKKRSKH